MKKKKNENFRILRHQKRLLEIDLGNAKRCRDEYKRKINDWRASAQKLADFFLKQKRIPREVKRIINNFPKC